MGGHKSISCSSPIGGKKPPPPVADYHVTGEITPDATGNYFHAGTYNDKPYYKHETLLFFIYWFPVPGVWGISLVLGEINSNAWVRFFPNIIGIYGPRPTYLGNAFVSAGPV